MRVIHKQVLGEHNRAGHTHFHLDIEPGARILHVANQYGDIAIWYECDPAASVMPQVFEVVGTGGPVPIVGDYVGSAILDGGRLVFHVYHLGLA